MNLGETVFQASLLLLYPVLSLLALAFLQMMWQLGEALQDIWAGRLFRHRDAVRQLRDIQGHTTEVLLPILASLSDSRLQHTQLRRFVRELLVELERGPSCTLSARVDHLLGRVESALRTDVDRVRVLVRLGPLLGLIGTLLPLGPGLMALNEGNLGRLSGQLVIAFSTTVVGLLIGGISYAIALARASERAT